MTSNSQSTKSLGQVAYEAHTPDYRVQWDDLWLGHRKAWQAAAEAVAAKIGNRELQAKSLAELDAECAVIEAAKALHAKMNRGEFASTADEQAGVWQALEALQEVE